MATFGDTLIEKIKELLTHQKMTRIHLLESVKKGGDPLHAHIFYITKYGVKAEKFDEIAGGYAMFTDEYTCACGCVMLGTSWQPY
jgi:hypothetical protein